MVQMKDDANIVFFKKRSKLYIPHGSDESLSVVGLLKLFLTLYIPHGSDESYLQLQHVLKVVSLYIPHGSDERRQ